MACCGPKDENSRKNQEINRQLARDRAKFENEIKLLLLGAGESGKSTIAKQMKIIHKEGFSPEERNSYKSIIYNNVVGAMRTIVSAAETLNIEIKDTEAAKRLMSGEEYCTGPLTSEMVADIKALYNDPGIKETIANAAKYQLIDSASYYFDNIDRIGAPDYAPTEQDVLRSRAKTTGIIEIEFQAYGTSFRMVDVGGQRSERKKWMHCFQDVTAVIFCVALSEYDLKLVEDDKTPRMHESLNIFKEIANSKWFTNTSMILFLNKRDLFAEKIKVVDLKVCFPEYTHGKDYNKAVQFIQDKFMAQNQSPNKVIYPHVTCATDTDNITKVFKEVNDIIVRKILDTM